VSSDSEFVDCDKRFSYLLYLTILRLDLCSFSVYPFVFLSVTCDNLGGHPPR
jgi:hypothetical protein